MFSLRKISVSLLVFFLNLAAGGNNPYHFPPGAAGAGRGSVCIMKPEFWSSFRNPALLSSFPGTAAGFTYENRFNISELGSRTAGLIIPAGRQALGMIYSHFGFTHFSRQALGIACGTDLSESISAGIQIDYFFEKTSGEYDNVQSVTFEGGLFIHPSESITLGIHIFNPVPNSLRKRMLPSSLRAGAGIKLNENLFAGAEAEMSSGNKLLVRTGFEYEAISNFLLRGGFSSENSSFSFGLGYNLNFMSIDISFATHERLGITSCFSMIFQLKNSK